MIQRSYLPDGATGIVAIRVEKGQAEQLAALPLPAAKGALEGELAATGLSRLIETIWNQVSSRGFILEVLVLEPGLVRGRLELRPAPEFVLSLPRMAMPSDQGLQTDSTTWLIAQEWREWLAHYRLDNKQPGFCGNLNSY